MNSENPYSPPESDVSLAEDREGSLLDEAMYANFGEIIWLKLRTSALVKLVDEVRVFVGYL